MANAGQTIDEIVMQYVTDEGYADSLGENSYDLIGSSSNKMLRWAGQKRAEIQRLNPSPLMRVGTVGDGNCMLHSILFATSPTYRLCTDSEIQSEIADHFRDILNERSDELRDLADIFFADIGGNVALEESFEVLTTPRDEIDLEMGLLIARLYRYNFLAIQIKSNMSLKPARLTHRNWDNTRPTILVNYIGGGLDFGQKGSKFSLGGHYEALLLGALIPDSPKIVRLDEHHTRFLFHEGEPVFDAILTMFHTPSPVMYNHNAYQAASKKSTKKGKPPIYPPTNTTKKSSPKGSPKGSPTKKASPKGSNNKTQKNLVSSMKALNLKNVMSVSEIMSTFTIPYIKQQLEYLHVPKSEITIAAKGNKLGLATLLHEKI